jgi:hypothetical protein
LDYRLFLEKEQTRDLLLFVYFLGTLPLSQFFILTFFIIGVQAMLELKPNEILVGSGDGSVSLVLDRSGQGSILRNSISAERLSDKFSSSNFWTIIHPKTTNVYLPI